VVGFTMEYVEGDDLDKVVARAGGSLPVMNACYYIHQAALGLQHAFEKGLVHRDIKPGNLLVARDGKKHVVKIADFGLAKLRRDVPPELAVVALKMLAKDPAGRYQTPGEVAQALLPFLKTSSKAAAAVPDRATADDTTPPRQPGPSTPSKLPPAQAKQPEATT